jgi:hypothetical protein
MAHKIGIVAASLIVAAAPALAARPAPASAPSASDSADARYCLRIEPVTGSLLETVRCWTRAEWDEQGVDVDKEWAKEGVAIIQ